MGWRENVLTDEAALREVVRAPRAVSADKVIDHLDEHCRRFIERSPFVLISTSSLDGRADISPKGDPPGFVRILDERTLAVPDRPGNGRIDTFVNVVENPPVGMIFLVPGVEETCRVNGRGAVTDDAELLEGMAVNGRTPLLALVVEVTEALVHCGKALRRSALWDAARHADAAEFPPMGRMLHDHARPEHRTREELVEIARADLETNLY